MIRGKQRAIRTNYYS